MKSNYKAKISQNERIEIVRNNLKMLLYALSRSEGFGEKRLLRVMHEFCEVVNNIKSSDDLMVIDIELEKILGKETMQNIGYELLKDNKGNIVK